MRETVNYEEAYNSLKSGEYSTERALDRMVAEYKVLLRGSVIEEPDQFVRPTDKDDTRVCATNLASIALLNALFSKDGNPVMIYPFYIDAEHPMELRIRGMNDKTIRDHGFVYIISNRSGFLRTPMGSWQYVKHSVEVPYQSMVEVLKEDFTYPVYDVSNNVRIQ